MTGIKKVVVALLAAAICVGHAFAGEMLAYKKLGNYKTGYPIEQFIYLTEDVYEIKDICDCYVHGSAVILFRCEDYFAIIFLGGEAARAAKPLCEEVAAAIESDNKKEIDRIAEIFENKDSLKLCLPDRVLELRTDGSIHYVDVLEKAVFRHEEERDAFMHRMSKRTDWAELYGQDK